MTRTDTAIEIMRKKSSMALGRGTIMIVMIAMIKATTVKFLALTTIFKKGAIKVSTLFCLFANGSLFKLWYL